MIKDDEILNKITTEFVKKNKIEFHTMNSLPHRDCFWRESLGLVLIAIETENFVFKKQQPSFLNHSKEQ